MTNLNTFKNILLPENLLIEYSLKVQPKYLEQIQQLIQFKLVAPIASARVQFVNGYFSILKASHPPSARCILNGKNFSSRCTTPTPVNLPEIPEILKCLSALHERVNRGRVTTMTPMTITADFRHWFHQFSLGSDISPYFCFGTDQGFFQWLGLPMGWSHSPSIAQAVSWWVALYDPISCVKEASATFQGSPLTPSFIYLREDSQDVGLVFLWYDNLVAVIYSNDHARAYEKMVRKNAKLICATWKEFNVTSAASIHTRHNNGPIFLGIQLGVLLQKRQSDAECSSRLVWRHDPKKIDKYVVAARLILISPSRRLVARAIGLIVWHGYMSTKPLCEEASSINLMKLNQGSMWDSPSPLTPDSLKLLSARLIEISANCWCHTWLPIPDAQVVFCASDSSQDCAGYLSLTGPQKYHGVRIIPWNETIIGAHIFIKELLAAVLAVEDISKSHPGCIIRLACDNVAVCHAIRRRFSSNQTGLELIIRLNAALTTTRCFLTIVSIRGVDNVADQPSRGIAIIDPVRLRATWLQIECAARGQTMLAVNPNSNEEKEDIRHSEPDDLISSIASACD